MFDGGVDQDVALKFVATRARWVLGGLLVPILVLYMAGYLGVALTDHVNSFMAISVFLLPTGAVIAAIVLRGLTTLDLRLSGDVLRYRTIFRTRNIVCSQILAIHVERVAGSMSAVSRPCLTLDHDRKLALRIFGCINYQSPAPANTRTHDQLGELVDSVNRWLADSSRA
jgi:hypothetical protein